MKKPPSEQKKTSPKEVNIHEAKTHLSRLLKRAEKGEHVVIMRAGVAIAKLVPIQVRQNKRILGTDAGKIILDRHFNSAIDPETFE